jgi:hypothetical protein
VGPCLITENVEFDTGCLETAADTHGVWEVIHKDSQTRIEREGRLMGIINQIPIEYLCDSIPEGIEYVEKHESRRGFGSHQF